MKSQTRDKIFWTFQNFIPNRKQVYKLELGKKFDNSQYFLYIIIKV